MYYFEVQSMPDWKDAFLKEHNLQLVSPSVARSFRTNNHSDDTPSWFAPDPIDGYEVWDKAGNSGSVWINKTTGYIFIYDWQINGRPL